ncbi:MAG: hypothetical protein M3153_03660 [Chloroflexota bacterium]|nr:hypothetical protein [Chloroflexota bacterium]
MIRRVLLTVAGVAWMVTLPMAADALLTSTDFVGDHRLEGRAPSGA